MSKTLSEMASEELIVRRRYHTEVIKLINAELSKRGAIKTIKITTPASKTVSKTTTSKKEPTRAVIIGVLEKHNIAYKKSASKAELMDIVRKNNLVRTVTAANN